MVSHQHQPTPRKRRVKRPPTPYQPLVGVHAIPRVCTSEREIESAVKNGTELLERIHRDGANGFESTIVGVSAPMLTQALAGLHMTRGTHRCQTEKRLQMYSKHLMHTKGVNHTNVTTSDKSESLFASAVVSKQRKRRALTMASIQVAEKDHQAGRGGRVRSISHFAIPSSVVPVFYMNPIHCYEGDDTGRDECDMIQACVAHIRHATALVANALKTRARN